MRQCSPLIRSSRVTLPQHPNGINSEHIGNPGEGEVLLAKSAANGYLTRPRDTSGSSGKNETVKYTADTENNTLCVYVCVTAS